MKSLLLLAVAAIVSLIGLHHVVPTASSVKSVSQVASAVAAASTSATYSVAHAPAIVPASTPVKSASVAPAEIQQTVVFAPVEPATTFVTQSQFAEAMSSISASLQQLLSESSADPTVSGVGAPLSAEAFAPSQRIDQLDDVAISNATFSNVSGLSASDIPALSSLNGTLGVSQGGTGTTTSPAYGQVLVGNSAGGYSLVATSSLGISGSSASTLAGLADVSLAGLQSGQLLSYNGSSWANISTSTLGFSATQWTTSGSNVYRPSGNVGIGTTSPATTLAVAGNTYLTGGFGVGAVNTTAGSIFATATTTALGYVASSNGSVGAPAYTFANALNTGIYSVGTNNLRFAANGVNSLTVTDSQVYVPLSGNASGPAIALSSSNLGLFSPSANVMAFSTGGTERMRLDGSGDLGIGTTTPGSLLSVGNTNGINFSTATSTFSTLGGISIASGCFAVASNCLGLGNLPGVLGVGSGGTGSIAFGQGWIYSNGGTNTLVASTSPTVAYITATSTSQASMLPYASSTALSVSGTAYFAGSGIWGANGDLGIGTTTLSAQFTVSGGGSSGTTLYSSAGTNESYTVPAGVTQITVRAWGGGGGGGQGNGFDTGGPGGGGGFAEATISVTPGETLSIDVGGGGGGGTTSGSGTGGTNGGGSAGSSTENEGNSGGGGGYSGVLYSGTMLLQAGGGGGGGAGAGADDTVSGAGGGGGGTSGVAGGGGPDGAGAGGAGTQSGGGGGGTSLYYCGTPGGSSGNSNQGGSGASTFACADTGGGGGGGHYGGGGAGFDDQGGAGGGGGSGYVTGTNTVNTAASGRTPANTSDPNYAGGAGEGGSGSGSGNGSNGSTGLVVITAIPSAAVQIVNSNDSSIATFLGSGNIGLGTSTPASSLVLSGAAGQGLLQIGTSTALNLFIIDQNGRVGINTANAGNYLAISTSSNLGTISLEFDGTTQYGGGFNDKRSGSNSDTMFNFMRNSAQVGSIAETNTATAYNTTSDRRLKENIATTTEGLSTLMQIPVENFDFINDPTHTELQGFIAQSLYPIYPEAVTTNGDNGVVPLGPTSTPWEVDYGRLTPLIVQSVQDIANITSTFQQNLIAWLGNAGNGIVDLFAENGHFSNELCVGSTCVTPAQFQAMVAAANVPQASEQGGGGASTATDTPPVIQINGDNPAVVQVGASYSDLGATIIGPQQDLNLGIQTYLNGNLSDPLVIDTSEPATDTVDYVVTDQNGLTSTSTRTVIVEPSASDGTAETPSHDGASTSTDATSTDANSSDSAVN